MALLSVRRPKRLSQAEGSSARGSSTLPSSIAASRSRPGMARTCPRAWLSLLGGAP